jgi:hypothetical protein
VRCCSPAASEAGDFRLPADCGELAELLALAEAHGVTGHVAARILRWHNRSGSREMERMLRDAQRRQSQLAMALAAELFRAQEVLSRAGLTSVVIKGPVLSARAFGDPYARDYGDIDFLVESSELERAWLALGVAGFRSGILDRAIEARRTPGQYSFRRSAESPLLELHTEGTLRYFPRPMPIRDFFARQTTVPIAGRAVPALSAEDEFVLISIHGAKHFWERLMWIADIAAIVDRHRGFDWSRVRQTAAQVGGERMVRLALLLAERFLGVPLPREMQREVAADSACLPLIKKIESWLPYAGQDPPALLDRALFRVKMRGEASAGIRYLTRLSLSPTEEDWVDDPGAPAASWRESFSRPFRLARKYRR